MHSGYIKLYRCLLEKGWSRKPEYVAVWVYLLVRANHKRCETFVDGRSIILGPGQFIASRLQISMNTGVQESKVERILKCFKTEQQIEQHSLSKCRIISIVNWDKYQECEHQNEQKVNSKRTTLEQHLNTDKNDKNEKNNNKGIFLPPSLEEVKAYCQERNRGVNPQKWFDFYQGKGWMVGKNKMKDWRAAVRTWEKDELELPMQSVPEISDAHKRTLERLKAEGYE